MHKALRDVTMRGLTPFTIALLWALPLIGFADPASVEFREVLSRTGITDRPPPRTLGKLSINPYILEDIRKLAPDQKEKLAAQLTRIVPQMSRERAVQPDQSINRDENPGPKGESPKLGILILREIGTDEQKISAFGELGLYGAYPFDSLSDACEALATCERSGGVDILKQYADGEFAALRSEPGNGSGPPGSARMKPDVNLYHAMIALAGAYHPDGPVVADKLRDQFVAFCKSHLDAASVAAIEKDLARDMEKARKNRENLIRRKRPDNKKDLGNGNIDTGASGTDPDLSSQATVSKRWIWVGVPIAAALLGLAWWKRMRSRHD